MPGWVNLRSQWRPLTVVPSGFTPSKLAPHGPPSWRLTFAARFVPPELLVVAFTPVRLPIGPELLPAGPASFFVMTGTGAVVARAIVLVSSSPGSPGSAPDAVASSRRPFVRPA